MSAAHALIEEWRRHLVQDRRRSLHTVRAYMATAERLVAFLQEHQGGAVTRDALAARNAADLRACLANRRMDGIGNNSTAREPSDFRGFLTYIGCENTRHPVDNWQRANTGVPRHHP